MNSHLKYSNYMLSIVLICAACQMPVEKPGVIAVNQFGYEIDAPKRFTAPEISDGTQFKVRLKEGKEALFSGEIKHQIGDFSSLRLIDNDQEYVVEMTEPNVVSDPFLIKKDLYKEDLWQLAIDYMIDCRSVTGTHPSAYGGTPWRDGTYYSYEVPSLIWLYRSDPGRFDQMPRQINYESDKERVLSPDFSFDSNNPQSQGVMEAVRRYYSELDPPAEEAPDIIKLIHWGLGFYLMKPDSQDPSNDPLPKQIHSQTVEQFAHFLYAYEELQMDHWISQEFYESCYALAVDHWETVGSWEIDSLWHSSTYEPPVLVDGEWQLKKNLHPYKGRHVPGHSILPNLYMHHVVQERDEQLAQQFLAAARSQTQFIIDSLDWKNPMTTKGHRGSEFQMMINLVWFLERFPDQAPVGLQAKIEDWARVVVDRSDNMWDFRRYDLQEHWTIPSMNETGNLAGFPACALAASWVVEDEKLRSRLVELAYAQLDNLFGRNPKLAAACNRPHQGYPFIERGWPISYHEDVTARLETVRGSLDASPGSEMYGYNPEGKFRHPEGWVNWNAALNVGLAYINLNTDRLVDSKIAPGP